MKKNLKIFLIVAAIGLVSGLATVYYIFNMPHRDIENESPAYTLTASALFNEYNSDEDAGNLKFVNQVLQVQGEIVDISINDFEVSFVLNDEMEAVNCAIDSLSVVHSQAFLNDLKIGDQISLKGKCDGLDMIMGVVLTRCYMLN